MPDIEGNIASANLSGEITTNSNLSGCIYPRGATGKSATIKIGKVITLDPEEQAEVINTGDENNAILDFKIPRGEVGHTEGGTWGKIIGKIEDQKDLMNILPNTSEFITKTVNDLENYYLKSETYTQTEVNQMISSIPKFAIEVIETLPTAEISNTTIYLLTSGAEEKNLYTEYIYVNNSWEKLGTQTVDLTNYYRKEEVNNLLNELDTIPKGGTTGQVLAKKTDTDNDVEWVDQSGSGSVTGDTLPIGSIMPYGSDTIPTNWLLCDGREVSRTEYQNLFNVIGTTYGAGDGTTTFNLPNLKGKVTVGKDNNDLNFDNLGETGGEKTHTLTIDEMPSHNHTWNWAYAAASGDATWNSAGANKTGTASDIIGSAGGNQPHNNMPPYLITNYIIKSNQSAGLVANVSNTKSTSDTDVYSATYINNIISNKLNITDLISFVYPVGSIYMSVNNVSPATFIGGTWEQIKDRFLLSAGDTYNAGDEGGNATHKHLSPMTWYENGGSNIGTTNLYGFDKVYDRDFYGIANQKIEYNKETEKLAYRTSTESNMPPYVAVYMWKRTA